jgi:streptogramin lyase
MKSKIVRPSILANCVAALLFASCASAPPVPPPAPPLTPASLELLNPTSLALDGQSRIYFSDQGLFCLFRMDDFSGKGLVTFGQKGYGGTGSFRSLEGDIALDREGRLYVVDPRASKLLRFDDMTGAGWTELDTASLGLPVPAGLAVDAQGRIYLGDSYTGRIARVDSMKGEGLVIFGEKGSGEGQFNDPRGISFDAEGRIYVVDNYNNRLVRMDDMSGANWTSYDGADSQGQGGFKEIARALVASDQSIYVSDPTLGQVFHFSDMSGAGREVWGWDGAGARPMQFFGIGLDGSNRILMVDNQGKRLVRIDNMRGDGFVSFPQRGL